MKNCLNCGAPLNPEHIKCEYCGTIYYDMTAINFDQQEPFFLAIKVNGLIITQLVRPSLADINFTHNTVSVTGRHNNTLFTFTDSIQVTTDITFEAIPQKDNQYMTIIKE